ncbi:MAG: fibronectin type III domain-containing protein [Lachnospiraceae bacterium]|nr:fibronectin type III domain-containing protein [Lachnospiraceae bacterium]
MRKLKTLWILLVVCMSALLGPGKPVHAEDDPFKEIPIEMNTPVVDTIEDEYGTDVYKFTVTKKESVRFEFKYWFEADIRVYKDSGTELFSRLAEGTESDPVTRENTIDLEPGDYLIKVFGYFDTGKYQINVNNTKVSTIQVPFKEITMYPDEEKDFVAVAYPEGAVNKKLTYKSSDTAVADCYNKKIGSGDCGTAVITVSAEDGSDVIATCKVTVIPWGIEGLKQGKETQKSIEISWDELDGTDGYNIYMYNNGKKEYVLYKTVSDNSAKLTGLKAETGYKIRISGYINTDDGKIEGAQGKAKTFYTAPKQLKAPQNVKIKMLNTVNYRTPYGTIKIKKFKVSWKKVKGAQKYKVYGKAPGKGWELLGSSKKTSKVLYGTAGYKYKVYVKAVRTKNKLTTEGKKSKEKTVNCK